jgi:subtilisin family serine protease
MRIRPAIATLVAALIAVSVAAVPAHAGVVERVLEPIEGSYIVLVNDGVPVGSVMQRYPGVINHVYQHAVNGFNIETTEAVARALAADPAVAKVEEDGVMRAITTQTNPPWGLDRIDQRALPLNQTYTYTNTGSGLKTYIIDTGIRTTHQQFGGRAIHGRDTVNNDNDASDCNGHGTHVAGTVGGSTYGVAKSTTLVAVRVLDCQGSGSTAGVIAGVDWVTGNHVAGVPAAANMSLGGGASSSLDTAVQNSINDGITYAIAAGNGDIFGNPQNACNSSPARVAAAITVSATNSSDQKASWANYGTCVDIFAPGVSIPSAWYTSDTATNTISGTSMASPHVAGVAAQYLQTNSSASPSAVASAIVSNSTTGVVSNPGTGSPNRLLYNAFIGGGTPPPNQSPTANFTHSCTGLSCTFTDTSSDPDGSITAWSWNFGDGTTSSAQHPSKTYTAAGTYTVSLTVTDNNGATGSTSKSVTVSSGGTSPCGADPNTSIPNLTNGVWTAGTAASTTVRWKDYKICVPSGRPSLRSDLDGTAGDLDLYVRYNALPTTFSYHCRSITSTADETCTVTNPSSGWWYVSVYTYNSAGAGTAFSIKATY